jgi:hypothetical protein
MNKSKKKRMGPSGRKMKVADQEGSKKEKVRGEEPRPEGVCQKSQKQ